MFKRHLSGLSEFVTTRKLTKHELLHATRAGTGGDQFEKMKREINLTDESVGFSTRVVAVVVGSLEVSKISQFEKHCRGTTRDRTREIKRNKLIM